jgi:hypothetical protein
MSNWAKGPTMSESSSERAIRLLQGYIWHPRDEKIDLADYLPRALEPSIHILWDAMPRAPFSFFDDGTLAASQQLYQLTVIALLGEDESEAGLVPWVAQTLQEKLEATPKGVGWQIFEDLRPL